MRRGQFIAGALAVAGLLAGCGPTVDEVPPETSAVATVAPSTTAHPDAGLWDPCSLPDSAISAAGLDAGSKVPDVAGVDFDGWQVCSWRGADYWYQLTVYSGTPSLDDVRERDDFTSFSDITVRGKPALRFLDADDTRSANCSVAVQSPGGIVMFGLVSRPTTGPKGDPCTEVQRQVIALASYLPGA